MNTIHPNALPSSVVARYATFDPKATQDTTQGKKTRHKRNWTQISRERRKRYLERGLTTMGTQRKTKRHPHLKGLLRKDYHRMWMRENRKTRAKD
jgi:hypothetical protein